MTQLTVEARHLLPGDWILHMNERFNERVVDVERTRDGDIKVYTDYGNGGEPATSFWYSTEPVPVERG